MVRPGFKEASQQEVISELGIFGYIIGGEEKKFCLFIAKISGDMLEQIPLAEFLKI